MFTSVAFFKDGANSSLAPIQPVSDPHVTVLDNDLTIPELDRLVYAVLTGTGMSQAQLQSPSLRRMWMEDIGKLSTGGLLAAAYKMGVDRREDPLELVRSEKLNVYTIQTSDGYALLLLADGPIVPVHGDIRTIKLTSAISGTEGVWTHGTLSFSQTLPAGRYQVVGFRGFETGLMAARLVFVGYTWRPGVPSGGAITLAYDDIFRRGRFGVFGEFEFDQPPSVDILCDRSVGGAQEYYMDLIQIRAGRS